MLHLLIYGATGYTGRLISSRAKELDIPFVLGGRTPSTLYQLSEHLDAPYRTFSITDDNACEIDRSLKEISVLLNCAGPFTQTAKPLVEACIRNGVHYLDISAELSSYLLISENDQEAKAKGVMLLPGCGGMLSCLASQAIAKVEDPKSVDIALRISGPMSQGSMTSAKGAVISVCLQWVDWELVKNDANERVYFDFGIGRGTELCSPVTLPDLLTLPKSTNIPHIRTFVHFSQDSGSEHDDALPGPTLEERGEHPYHAAVVVRGEGGVVQRGELHTVNGYNFTAEAAVEAARRVLAGQIEAGFQTPVTVFGPRFAEEVRGTKVIVH